jgi:hypothetical protein
MKLAMFRQTPRAQLGQLARTARVHHFRRGALIARRGEPPPRLRAVG